MKQFKYNGITNKFEYIGSDTSSGMERSRETSRKRRKEEESYGSSDDSSSASGSEGESDDSDGHSVSTDSIGSIRGSKFDLFGDPPNSPVTNDNKGLSVSKSGGGTLQSKQLLFKEIDDVISDLSAYFESKEKYYPIKLLDVDINKKNSCILFKYHIKKTNKK